METCIGGEVVKKCIVLGCSSRDNEGPFVGDICRSCYDSLKSGIVRPSSSFLYGLIVQINETDEALATIQKLVTKALVGK